VTGSAGSYRELAALEGRFGAGKRVGEWVLMEIRVDGLPQLMIEL
jgi:hypothetical protein